MNKIQSCFLDSGDRRIFYTMFGGDKDAKTCMLVFLPLFEERMWSQRIAVHFGRELGKNGNPVVIWDYYGYGESDGDSEDFTLRDCRQDVQSIITHLKSDYGFSKFSFLGIRAGCGIACHVLAKGIPEVTHLVFWAPVIDLKNFLFKSLRSTISTQSYVFKKIVANRDTIIEELLREGKCSRNGYILNHIDGYRIGKTFYEEIVSFGGILLPVKEDIQIFYLDIVPDGKETLLERMKEEQEKKLTRNPCTSYTILMDREFWINNRDYSQMAEKIYAITMEWLKMKPEQSKRIGDEDKTDRI